MSTERRKWKFWKAWTPYPQVKVTIIKGELVDIRIGMIALVWYSEPDHG